MVRVMIVFARGGLKTERRWLKQTVSYAIAPTAILRNGNMRSEGESEFNFSM